MTLNGNKPMPLVERMETIPSNLLDGEFTFRDLSDWFATLDEIPRYIGMTYDQENWFRQLLGAKFMTFPTVTFKGIVIIIID